MRPVVIKSRVIDSFGIGPLYTSEPQNTPVGLKSMFSYDTVYKQPEAIQTDFIVFFCFFKSDTSCMANEHHERQPNQSLKLKTLYFIKMNIHFIIESSTL